MLTKSPMNYTGGKYKLLPQLLPIFPSKIDTFVDMFGGGGDVFINTDAKEIYYNDILEPVSDLILTLKNTDLDVLLKDIVDIVNKFSLSNTNKDGYLNLRKYYNSGNRSAMVFYMLIAHSFSNQIRFNRKGEFNLPFGKRYFNNSMRENFITFVTKLKEKNLIVLNKDFRNVDINPTKDSLAYFDPPYLISTATFNESGGWTEKDELDLLSLLDEYNRNGIKFGLSNVLENKGQVNTILKKWSDKYNLQEIEKSYTNCNYHRKRGDESLEVFITNY